MAPRQANRSDAVERDDRDEEFAVRAWRYEQARSLGLAGDDATRFAESDGDLGQLRELIVKAGCDPHTAALIVA